MGTFAAVQTAGMVMAPLCGGLLGAIEPRLAFAVPGLVALCSPPRRCPAPPARRRARRARACATRSRAARRRSPIAGFLAFLAINGVAFLVALRAADSFGLDTTERGLLLAGFGLAGVSRAGRRAGSSTAPAPRRSSCAARCSARRWSRLLGLAGTVGAAGALWLAAGAGSAFVWAGLNTLAVQSAPENRGGAISVVGAFKFAGSAVAPLVWLPLYVARDELAFAAGGRRLRADRARRRRAGGGPRRIAVAAAERARRRPRPAQQ